MSDREKEVEWLKSEIETVLKISEAEDWLMLPVRRTVDILKRTKKLLNEHVPVRCGDCAFGIPTKNGYGEDVIECCLSMEHICHSPEWYCADGDRDEEK